MYCDLQLVYCSQHYGVLFPKIVSIVESCHEHWYNLLYPLKTSAILNILYSSIDSVNKAQKAVAYPEKV